MSGYFWEPGILSNRIKFEIARRLIEALLLGVVLFGWSSTAAAEDGSSSIADRKRFVSITRELEKAPLDPALKVERAWAMNWLVEAPDVSVTVCADSLGGLAESNAPHSVDILALYMYSMAASIIEHPETANNAIAVQVAGIEGALTAYRSILAVEPEARSTALEDLIKKQNQSELPDFARQALVSCRAKGESPFLVQP
ncbi:MAG: hypothetical protein JWQ16_959 [Novosphingobium sp.]|nr:hypothetical protein [Novosphingobium sp.]